MCSRAIPSSAAASIVTRCRVFPSTSARPKKTCPVCSIELSTRTGSCSLTRPMPCSGNARRCVMPTIAMPTRKSRSCCSGSRPTTSSANHVDEAFARRFEHLVHFPVPRQSERLLIWKKGLPAPASLEPAIDLAQVAARYEMSGGMIMNVIRYASLQAISRSETVLRQHDLLDGIRREFAKENRLE